MRTKSLVIACGLVLGLVTLASSRGAIVNYVLLQAASPGTAQLGHANLTGTIRAGQFTGTSTTASTTPVIGNNTSSDSGAAGGSFSTFSQDGIGLKSTATNNGGFSKAIYAESRAKVGVAIDCLAKGVNSNAIHAQSLGDNPTVFVQNSGMGTGVVGVSNEIGLHGVGKAQGVSGTCQALDSGTVVHAGFYGVCDNSGTGTAYGVYGHASNSGSGTTYGVAGQAIGGGTKWGLYAFGNSGGTGTKSFEIDDPLAPETTTLRHYSAEGAEPLLVYSGNVTLDSHGRAVVRLPDYVAAIGRDFRYQLTPLGASMPNLFVSRLFSSGSFSIDGGAPGATVSWTLTGVRNDRWVQKYGAPVEVSKPASMQGRYLEPELYGKPESMGVRG